MGEWLCAGCGCSTFGDANAICIQGINARKKRYHESCARCRWCDKPVNKETCVAVWGTKRFRQKLACVDCASSLDTVGSSVGGCSGCGLPVSKDDASAICLERTYGQKKWYHLDCAQCRLCSKNLSSDHFVRVWGSFRLRQKLICTACSPSEGAVAVQNTNKMTLLDYGNTVRPVTGGDPTAQGE